MSCDPFQRPVTDSCRTILCTKCHLSYYEFSAEYSADPKGLRTKRESAGRDTYEMPRGNCHNLLKARLFHGRSGLRVRRGQQRSLTATTTSPSAFASGPRASAQRDLSRRRKWFVSPNGVGSLVTFRQP